MVDLAKNATNNGTIVMISNHDTPFTRELYYGSDIKSFPVRRGITNKSNRSKPAQELVAIFGV